MAKMKIKLGKLVFDKEYDVYLSPPDLVIEPQFGWVYRVQVKHLLNNTKKIRRGTLEWHVWRFLQQPEIQFILKFFV